MSLWVSVSVIVVVLSSVSLLMTSLVSGFAAVGVADVAGSMTAAGAPDTADAAVAVAEAEVAATTECDVVWCCVMV